MITRITPKTIWLPSYGNVTINAVELRVSSYELGVGAQAFYNLLHIEDIPAVAGKAAVIDKDGNVTSPSIPEVPATTKQTAFNLIGNSSLSPEDFAKWGTDDDYFCNCICKNIDVVPLK